MYNTMNQEYVHQTMLTCIGNKRKLVNHIVEIVDEIALKLQKEKLNIVDAFAGSSVVSRALSYRADTLHTNDLELYSYYMAQAYLQTPSVADQTKIRQHIDIMNHLANNGPHSEGIICKLYAPKSTKDIKEGERCFYTRENALIIDTLRKYITDHVEPSLFVYCIVPLLNKASIHTNTAGVFKGFYKKGTIGCFGGAAENALSRIMKPIQLEMPIWNDIGFTCRCYHQDINVLIHSLPDNIDVMYLDPPYNQHPYGSNYFMLNVIATNVEPVEISKVSGIPTNWNKSNYNKKAPAFESMKQLLEIGLQKSRYLVLSYNNEGILSIDDWNNLFSPYCVEKREIDYDTFKGSRNLKERSNKVVEIMYIISRP